MQDTFDATWRPRPVVAIRWNQYRCRKHRPTVGAGVDRVG